MNSLTLIGFLLIKDEIREEAIEGVDLVKKAGIQTVMITGDNKETAYSIAKEVGIIDSSTNIVLTSSELNNMSDDEIKKILKDLRVVARSLPKDKSRLVKLSESPSHGKPIIAYDPKSRGSEAYLNLAKEVISRNGN